MRLPQTCSSFSPLFFALAAFLLLGCPQDHGKRDHKTFKLTPIFPKFDFPGQLIHRGLFAPDGQSYWYVLSDPQCERFDVMVSRKQHGRWVYPAPAFFNSGYSEHGMSFSPDGQWLYFSSTRPSPPSDSSSTWRIWRSQARGDSWSAPEWVDFPGLNQQFCSHPSISESGKLYFHSSNPDYSEMYLYSAQEVGGNFENAQRIEFPEFSQRQMCTPFVAADESYLLFAVIGTQLDLHISFKNQLGNWGTPVQLEVPIVSQGQGNPSLASGGRFLLYTQGTEPSPDAPLNWEISTVSFQKYLEQAQARHKSNLKRK